MLGIIFLLALVDLKRRGYSKELSWEELLKLYVLSYLAGIKMYFMHKKFEKNVRQFEQVRRYKRALVGNGQTHVFF